MKSLPSAGSSRSISSYAVVAVQPFSADLGDFQCPTDTATDTAPFVRFPRSPFLCPRSCRPSCLAVRAGKPATPDAATACRYGPYPGTQQSAPGDSGVLQPILLLFGMVLGFSPSAMAATLRVANTGLDGPTCGPSPPAGQSRARSRTPCQATRSSSAPECTATFSTMTASSTDPVKSR